MYKFDEIKLTSEIAKSLVKWFQMSIAALCLKYHFTPVLAVAKWGCGLVVLLDKLVYWILKKRIYGTILNAQKWKLSVISKYSNRRKS